MGIVRRKKGQWLSARLQRIGSMLLLLLCKRTYGGMRNGCCCPYCGGYTFSYGGDDALLLLWQP